MLIMLHGIHPSVDPRWACAARAVRRAAARRDTRLAARAILPSAALTTALRLSLLLSLAPLGRSERLPKPSTPPYAAPKVARKPIRKSLGNRAQHFQMRQVLSFEPVMIVSPS